MDNRMENSNSDKFHAVMDGTVVKPPYTGVQNSVQHEIAAELRALKGCCRWKILLWRNLRNKARLISWKFPLRREAF